MADKWTWYRAAIAAKNEGKPLPPIKVDQPECGVFWRKASKAGGRIPVLINLDDNGELYARCGTRESHRLEDASRIWSWCAENVVDRDSYKHAYEAGTWPDGTPTAAADASGPAAAGDNLPTDPYERLKAQVDDKLASAQSFLEDAKAKPDKTRADMARNIQAELLALNKTANNMHVTEKAPHLAACREVDDKFRFRDTVATICARLRTVFENIAKRLEAEANETARREHERKVREAEEERQRLEAERAKKLADDPIAALTEDAPELPMAPPPPEPVKVNVGGGVGRAAGLKTVWVPEIIDYEATLKHYSKHPDIRAAVEKLVRADAKVHKEATNVPGVKMTADRKAA